MHGHRWNTSFTALKEHLAALQGRHYGWRPCKALDKKIQPLAARLNRACVLNTSRRPISGMPCTAFLEDDNQLMGAWIVWPQWDPPE